MIILETLKKPHPFIFNRLSVLIPAVITFAVLLIFRPFEFDGFSVVQLLSWSGGFALLVCLSVWITVWVVKKSLPDTLEENWTVGKEILLILFVIAIIGLAIFLLFLVLNPRADRAFLFRLVFVRTLVISFFPVLVMVLFEQSHHQKIKWREVESLNRNLQQKQDTIEQESMPKEKIILVAENQKIALQLTPEDLLFIKSEGNYLEVFYRQHQKIQIELIRNSLKAIEEQLPANDFFRCHKSFLINLRHIQKATGNARNLELILENIVEKIPVSRSKSATLLQVFKQSR